MMAMTLSHEARLLRLITSCHIALPSHEGKQVEALEFNALWDTGAERTTITNNVASLLGLKPVGLVNIAHAQGESIVNQYMVDIFLPNKVRVNSILVNEGILKDFDVLIGMDIISLGDFALTNRDGKTVFSFQMPSTHLYDFVKQINTQRAKQTKAKKRNPRY